ncbi:DUF2335 domain-containing protein [Marinospirillum insulare]|uniref:DUF2335 domain-containing protein n=1 Tax=Marinospirillum insulare TaxID=217169 RepID=A0ABQ6A1H2_9GAMM|nr:DUF2335 domain-containing protein [Marinospirillum insulare]GLR64402.1 hypothetical protein GCM10007878_18400 [Marinospirillum insulare]
MQENQVSLSPEKEAELNNLLARLEAGKLSADEQQRLGQVLPSSNVQVMLQMAMHSESYSGPLPHPDQLNKFSPETQKAILQMAQSDQAHVQEMQRKGLEGAIAKDRRGQWMGFGIAISGLVTAGVVAQFSPAVAGLIAALDLVGMVAVFVVPRAFEKFGLPNNTNSGIENSD